MCGLRIGYALQTLDQIENGQRTAIIGFNICDVHGKLVYIARLFL